MRVGILTSWRVPCGVYQYSARFADALAEVGHEPVILALRADEHRSVPEESQHEIHEIGTIGLWRDDGAYRLLAPFIPSLALDAIHVQYQSMLVTQPDLLALRGAYDGTLAITFHDNCQAPDFPYGAFDLSFTHRWNVGPPFADVIPFGIEDRPPLVRTFGLGRSRSDLIAEVCERNGWRFESASSHEPIHGGGQPWRTHSDLIDWLRGADAIVLWYDDHPAAGSSQAARTAIAARRPLFTNATKWFEDLPTPLLAGRRGVYYEKVYDPADLEAALWRHFDRPFVAEQSWARVAAMLVKRYQAVPARV